MKTLHNKAGHPGAKDAPAAVSTGSSSATSSSSDAGALLSHRQIMAIFIGLMLGMFLAALDQMIVGTAIRTIADDLNGLSLQAWATTAYLITSTIATPLYGKLSDMYGRKPFFLLAISLFIIGSIACTFSQSMYQLAAFRGFQGLGAGGLMALALAIIGDVVAPRERAKYQGYFMAVFGISSVLGPVLGGFFAGQSMILGIAGWRWVFLVNVPIAAIALVVVAKVLNVPHTSRRHRIDWPGALALIVCLVPLLVVAEQGRDWGWGSPRALACYVIGAVGLVLFVLAERWAKEEALIPLRLFRNSVVSLMSVASVVVGFVMFGGMSVLPLYLQIVHGASPTKAGLLILPMVAGLMVSLLLSGQLIARTGRYKIFPVVGSILVIAGMGIMSSVGADTPLWQVDIYMLVIGLGIGCCMQILTLAVQNAVPPKDMGVASASSTFFRQMGATLGTAVLLSVLFSTVGDKIKNAFQKPSIASGITKAMNDPNVQRKLQDTHNSDYAPIRALVNHQGGGGKNDALNDTSFLQHIDSRLARPFLVGFSGSMDLVFLVAALVMVIALVLFTVTREVPLRMQSGLEARAAGERDKDAAPTPQTSLAAEVPAPIESDLAPATKAAETTVEGASEERQKVRGRTVKAQKSAQQ